MADVAASIQLIEELRSSRHPLKKKGGIAIYHDKWRNVLDKTESCSQLRRCSTYNHRWLSADFYVPH